jgi:hypothetical protein
MPLGLKPRGLIWQVDGRTVALTNKSPYRIILSRERFTTGKHTARVVVMTEDGNQEVSPEISFSFAPDTP